MIQLSIIVVTVLIVSALCSMMEAALFSVPVSRVEGWTKKNIRFSTTLLKIKNSIHQPIAAIVILNNLSNIGGSILVGTVISSILNEVWIGIISTSFTFLIIIFSEIIPKSIGNKYAEPLSLIFSPLILFLTKLFAPILSILEWLIPSRSKLTYPQVSEEEIKILAKLGNRQGSIKNKEAWIINKALLLNDIRVKEIMTPRINVEALDQNQHISTIKDQILQSPFSRLPLYEDNLDQVTGILYKEDVLKSLLKKEIDISLHQLRKNCLFIPENKAVDCLLEELRNTHSHTAIVIDEYGGMAGLVTLEDILEEIVGDIIGEEDSNRERYRIVSDNEIVAPGHTFLNEVNDYFQVELVNPYRTLSKVILDELNRFPKSHEHIELSPLIFIVEEITEKTIKKIRIKRKKSANQSRSY